MNLRLKMNKLQVIGKTQDAPQQLVPSFIVRLQFVGQLLKSFELHTPGLRTELQVNLLFSSNLSFPFQAATPPSLDKAIPSFFECADQDSAL